MKKTRRSLFASLTTLILCFAMFVGSTFAWFTDTVENKDNKIQAGTLDVGLEKWKQNPVATAGSSGQWEDISNNPAPIFNYELWEPGYSEIVGLRVVNNGTLALKYMINVVAKDPEQTKLAEAIDVYSKIVPSEQFELPTSFDVDTALENGYKVTPLSNVLSYDEGAAHGALLASQDNAVPDGTKLEAKESAAMIIVLHMKEEARNEYQGLSLGSTFDINVFATQYTHEADGFGNNQYDIDTPWMGETTEVTSTQENVYEVSNGAELAWIAQLVNNGDDLNGKTVRLVKDIDLNNIGWTPIGSSSYAFNGTFDGQNHTVLNLKVQNNQYAGLFGNAFNHGIIKNVKVKNATINSHNKAGAILGGGYADIINCHVENADIEVSTWIVNGNYDDGDKAGAIVGQIKESYAYTVEGCSAKNVTITGYRDIGGLIGYGYAENVFKNNTITNGKIINDRTHNYQNYTEDSKYDVNEIVGEYAGVLDDTNKYNEVTITKISPVIVPQDADSATITNEIKNTLDTLKPGDELILPNVEGGVKLPDLKKDVIIKGDGDTVVDAKGGGNIAKAAGVEFDSLVFEVGQNNYHGFQHASPVLKNCIIKGLLFSYAEGNEPMVFENCTFIQDKEEYNMWAYGPVVYKNCTFKSYGKFVNVYNEGNEHYDVKFENCIFENLGEANKSAINVKATCGATKLNISVDIKNCTTIGSFPTNKRLGKKVVMIDDGDSDNVSIVLDGEILYDKNHKDTH